MNIYKHSTTSTILVLWRTTGQKSSTSVPPPSTTASSADGPCQKGEEEDSLADLKMAFQLLDVDQNGEITKRDLESFMKDNLCESPTETELQEMIMEVRHIFSCSPSNKEYVNKI